MNILTAIKTHRAMATMLFANAGVAVSVLFGAFQFFATYEQTQEQVSFLSEELDQVQDRVVFLESQLEQVHSARDTVQLLDGRVDELDDFVVRWDEQSNQIMVEHNQLGDIVEDIYARLDELSGERTRVTLPAGSQRGYGYD